MRIAPKKITHPEINNNMTYRHMVLPITTLPVCFIALTRCLHLSTSLPGFGICLNCIFEDVYENVFKDVFEDVFEDVFNLI